MLFRAIIILGALGNAVSQSPSLNSKDLAAWGNLYNGLKGESWKCKFSMTDPCLPPTGDCSSSQFIGCTEDEISGKSRITEISLQDNGLTGFVNETWFDDLSALVYLRMEENQLSVNGGDCLKLPQCYSGALACLFDRSGIQVCPLIVKKSASPTASPTRYGVYREDLRIWQALFDSMSGPKWNICSGAASRRNPCNCGSNAAITNTTVKVTCKTIDNRLRITSINLSGNGLHGWLPEDAINAMEKLTEFNVNNNDLTNTACLSIPRCYNPMLTCSFDNTGTALCAAPPSISPTKSPEKEIIIVEDTDSPTATNSPTSSPILDLDKNDLIAWQALFSSLGRGAGWASCGNELMYRNPCTGCLDSDSSERQITCKLVNGKLRLTEIQLRQNNIKNRWFASAAVNALRALEVLDISNDDPSSMDANAFINTNCVFIDRCYATTDDNEPQALCDVANTGLVLCPPPTPNPTPEPTASPTTRTPSANPVTVTPTSNPTKPTTMMPTKKPTTSPTRKLFTAIEDLTQWTLFTTALKANKWLRCKDSKNPCFDCKSDVTCVDDGNFFRISSIVMPNNNLQGVVPQGIFVNLPRFMNLNVANDPNVKTNLNNLKNPNLNAICSPIDVCYQRNITCSFTGTSLNLCPPQHSTSLDLALWQSFYDALGGISWIFCSEYRNDPCACSVSATRRVLCEPVSGGNVLTSPSRISEISLVENFLRGTVPAPAVKAMSGSLKVLNLGNTGAGKTSKQLNVFTGTCVDLYSTCLKVLCTFDKANLKVCPAATFPSDLVSWQLLYDSLKGDSWTSCGGKPNRLNPCANGRGCETKGINKVTCVPSMENPDAFKIEEIVLRDNKLNGVLPNNVLLGFGSILTFDVSTSQVGSSANKLLNKPDVCVSLPRCFLGLTACDFTGTPVKPCNATFSPTTLKPTRPAETRSPTIPDNLEYPLNPMDLLAWQAFYTATNGHKWISCNETYTQPCSCRSDDVVYVSCSSKVEVNQTRITGISLPNVDLYGWLPDDAISTMDYLQYLNLRGNTFTNSRCVEIMQCMGSIPKATCILMDTDLELCKDLPITSSPTLGANQTQSPTTEQTTLYKPDLLAWRALYDALSQDDDEDDDKSSSNNTTKKGWVECYGDAIRNDPCSGCPTTISSEGLSGNARLVCESVKGKVRLTEIKLIDNNLRGWLPESALRALTELKFLDLSSTKDSPTPNILKNGQCVRADHCYLLGNACILTGTGVSICPKTTLNPTRMPSSKPTTATPTSPVAPTAKPTVPLVLANQDLYAWQGIYDSMAGEQWAFCADARDDPCVSCNNISSTIRVTCKNFVPSASNNDKEEGEANGDLLLDPSNQVRTLRITEIVLQNNRLVGFLPTEAVESLSMLELLDLSNDLNEENRNILINLNHESCLKISRCVQLDTVCFTDNTGFALCSSATRSPTTPTPPTVLTAKPTTTLAPTIVRTLKPTSKPTPKPTISVAQCLFSAEKIDCDASAYEKYQALSISGNSSACLNYAQLLHDTFECSKPCLSVSALQDSFDQCVKMFGMSGGYSFAADPNCTVTCSQYYGMEVTAKPTSTDSPTSTNSPTSTMAPTVEAKKLLCNTGICGLGKFKAKECQDTLVLASIASSNLSDPNVCISFVYNQTLVFTIVNESGCAQMKDLSKIPQYAEVYASVSCCDTNGCNNASSVVLPMTDSPTTTMTPTSTAVPTSTAAPTTTQVKDLQCYNGVCDEEGYQAKACQDSLFLTSLASENMSDPNICISYLSNHTLVFTIVSETTCSQVVSLSKLPEYAGLYASVTCCNTNGCNNVTTVVLLPATSSPTVFIAGTQSPTLATNTTSETDAPTPQQTDAPTFEATDAPTTPMPTSTVAPTIEEEKLLCNNGVCVLEGFSAQECQDTLFLASAVSENMSDPNMCITYLNNQTFVFTIVSKSTCAQMKDLSKIPQYAEVYASVSCCDTNGCNNASSVVLPTTAPTVEKTDSPTIEMTNSPTVEMTDSPTIEMTSSPTAELTDSPTVELTDSPTVELTDSPTVELTDSPTVELTDSPTVEFTVSPSTSLTPSLSPSAKATDKPTIPVTVSCLFGSCAIPLNRTECAKRLVVTTGQDQNISDPTVCATFINKYETLEFLPLKSSDCIQILQLSQLPAYYGLYNSVTCCEESLCNSLDSTSGIPKTISPTGTNIPTASPSTANVTSTSSPTTSPVVTTTASPTITNAPVTEAPATLAPVTEAPVTLAPVTEAPVTAAPVTLAPVTETPTTTSAPITDSPVTKAPIASTKTPTITADTVAPTASPTRVVIVDETKKPTKKGFRFPTSSPTLPITGAPVITDAPVSEPTAPTAPTKPTSKPTSSPLLPETEAPVPKPTAPTKPTRPSRRPTGSPTVKFNEYE